MNKLQYLRFFDVINILPLRFDVMTVCKIRCDNFTITVYDLNIKFYFWNIYGILFRWNENIFFFL